MLFSEFREGTGCRDNEYNHKVYRDLEVMYMNSELSKAEIYEYGKKLVDNSDTPEQIALKKQVQAEISELQSQLKQYRSEVKRYDEYYRADRTDKFWKDQRDWSKKCAAKVRDQIARLKWVLE